MNALRWPLCATILLACTSPSGGVDATVRLDASVDGSLPDGSTDARTDTLVDAGFDATPDTSMPMVGRPCSTEAECDDGNPRTTDSCLTLAGSGVCVYRDCFVDEDCDDGDPLTFGTCAAAADGVSYLCDQVLRPLRCRVAADCETALPCESATCDSGGFCRYLWPDDCGAIEEMYPPCTAAERENAICCDGPTCLPVCRVSGSSECPLVLACGRRTGETVSRYRRLLPAGRACPSAECPDDPPAHASACDLAQPTCDYGPGAWSSLGDGPSPDYDYSGGPTCRCDEGAWSCSGSWCPLHPPDDGAPAAAPTWAARPSIQCDYRGLRCMVLREGDDTIWRCQLRYGACPSDPPLTEGACTLGYDGIVCSYDREMDEPADAYNGECRCTGEGWQCGQNRAATCPTVAPEEMTSCSANAGNQGCRYFSPDGARECWCDAFDGWTCSDRPT